MNKHILIIEDEPSTAEMLMLCMEINGFNAFIIDNGDAAMEYMKTHASDIALILLDLMLPGKDGVTFLQEIKTHSDLASIPIIIQSGSSDEEIEKVRKLGIKHVVRKPYDNRQLIQIIRSLIP